MSEFKRKRIVLNIQQKLEIVDQLEKGTNAKQLALQYGIGEQTVRDLKKKKDDLISFASSSSRLKNRKTMKRSSYDDLDKAMLVWFNRQRAQGMPVSGRICAKQAKFFFEALRMEGNFDASSGWLTRFKQRHGIHKLSIQREKLSGNVTAANEFCVEFREFIKSEELVPDQIYSAHETGLYWKCLPTKTLSFENKQHESSKERLTVMCCSNASGTHKLKLAVIGKVRKPFSFNGIEASDLPVHYLHQKGAWMNRDIFKEWFDKIFVPQVCDHLMSKGLPDKAVLLLNNAPSHPNERLVMSEDGKIFVQYIPANIVELIQPMDQGVISCMKLYYRSNLLQKCMDEGNNLKRFWMQFTVLDAIYDIALAWSMVKPLLLIRSWRKIISDISEDDNFAGYAYDVITTAELAQIANKISGAELIDENNISEWLGCDACEPGFETLSNDDIVRSLCKEEENVNGIEEEWLISKNRITHGAALNHLDCLLDYLENEEDSGLGDKLMLRRLRSDIRKKESLAKKSTLTDHLNRV